MSNYQYIHQRIVVTATFAGAKPVIEKFVWHDKEFIVQEVLLQVRARAGREVVWLFNVSTSSGAYKLRFDTESLYWWLEELTWEE